MLADPQFKAEVEKLKVEIDALDGAAMHRLVADSLKMSNDTRDKARTFYDEMFK